MLAGEPTTRFRVHDVADIDDEFRARLAEAYAVGEQRPLTRATSKTSIARS